MDLQTVVQRAVSTAAKKALRKYLAVDWVGLMAGWLVG